MSVLTYTAVDRGHMLAGTSAGTQINIEIPLGFEKFTPFQQRKGVQQRALDGTTVDIFHRTEFYAYVTTHWIDDETIQDRIYYEFADSVAAGEVFQIDPYGTLASPVEVFNVKLQKGNSIAPSRFHHWPRFKYAFTVEIL